MGWSGYITLFLVITANLIDLDRENLNITSKFPDGGEHPFQPAEYGVPQRTLLSNLLSYLDIQEGQECGLNLKAGFGGGYSDTEDNQLTTGDDMVGEDADTPLYQVLDKAICFVPANDTFNWLVKPEIEVKITMEIHRELIPKPENNDHHVPDLGITGNSTFSYCPVEKQPIEFDSPILNHDDHTDQFGSNHKNVNLDSEADSGIKSETDLQEIDEAYFGWSVEFAQDIIAEVSDDVSDTRDLPADQANLNLDDTDLSVVQILSHLLDDHITEPLLAWWADDWAKYLRQYIMDIKYLQKSISYTVTYTIEKMPSQIYKFYIFTSNWFLHLDELSFEKVYSSIHLFLSSLSDNAVNEVTEICNPDGKVRLAIRQFMHNKDFRFNYFWYCFYTTFNVLDLVLMIHMAKKVRAWLFHLSHLLSGLLMNMFSRTKKADAGVSTEPYDPSLIAVDKDVLRRLMENEETEEERLEDIRELQEQIGYAKQMADWSEKKRAGLSAEIDRIGADSSMRVQRDS